ncbi:hypothetical protein M9H77_17444 [Catharanthus roseus]|uniref:Uncharacterized protein n=1 Tax=Catharanthus roseus TaxID=4058 RepID=A0ACC0B4K1_CATRO|nr:hypothetical protein M9H77_17444 [Catharanthus roseus]
MKDLPAATESDPATDAVTTETGDGAEQRRTSLSHVEAPVAENGEQRSTMVPQGPEKPETKKRKGEQQLRCIAAKKAEKTESRVKKKRKKQRLRSERVIRRGENEKLYSGLKSQQAGLTNLTDMNSVQFSAVTVVYNAYLDGLIKRRNASKALEIFQRMERDRSKQILHGLEVVQRVRSKRCKPIICTYTAMINAFARDGLREKAEEIFEMLQEAGYEPDVYAYNALMEAYSEGENKKKKKDFKLLHGTEECLTCYISDYLLPLVKLEEVSPYKRKPPGQGTLGLFRFPHGAAKIFSLMNHMGCEPDRASYNIMVDAYGRAGLHEDAEAAFEEMMRLGIKPTMKSYMLLISAFSRTSNIQKCQFEKMEQVLEAMENGLYKADISTYNIFINAYGRGGFFEKMEEVFFSLAAKNMKPDVVTWTCRLGAYSRKNLYKKCLEIFEEMIDSGCHADGGTAKVLLNSFSNDDQIEQITTVVRTMHKTVRSSSVLLPW